MFVCVCVCLLVSRSAKRAHRQCQQPAVVFDKHGTQGWDMQVRVLEDKIFIGRAFANTDVQMHVHTHSHKHRVLYCVK